MLEQGEMKWAV